MSLCSSVKKSYKFFCQKNKMCRSTQNYLLLLLFSPIVPSGQQISRRNLRDLRGSARFPVPDLTEPKRALLSYVE